MPALLLGSVAVLMLVALWLAWKAGELRQLRGAAWRADPEETPQDETAPAPPKRQRPPLSQASPRPSRPAG
ncbi:hypothetical protein [Acidovorax sp.]|uniref:hypothetical protein n=1 Tax=Acidovorax sp. TaxID=1872122 RepID=UPI0025C3CB42|nr:hypothetical protein [Acidovorax sp.]MBW8462346.1 hypothetical protein [Acidovorax sp.]